MLSSRRFSSNSRDESEYLVYYNGPISRRGLSKSSNKSIGSLKTNGHKSYIPADLNAAFESLGNLSVDGLDKKLFLKKISFSKNISESKQSQNEEFDFSLVEPTSYIKEKSLSNFKTQNFNENVQDYICKTTPHKTPTFKRSSSFRNHNVDENNHNSINHQFTTRKNYIPKKLSNLQSKKSCIDASIVHVMQVGYSYEDAIDALSVAGYDPMLAIKHLAKKKSDCTDIAKLLEFARLENKMGDIKEIGLDWELSSDIEPLSKVKMRIGSKKLSLKNPVNWIRKKEKIKQENVQNTNFAFAYDPNSLVLEQYQDPGSSSSSLVSKVVVPPPKPTNDQIDLSPIPYINPSTILAASDAREAGNLHYRLGQYQHSLEFYKNGIDKFANCKTHPYLIVLFNNTANVYMKLKQERTALMEVNKAICLLHMYNDHKKINLGRVGTPSRAKYESQGIVIDMDKYCEKTLSLKVQIYMKSNDHLNAIVAYEKLAELTSSNDGKRVARDGIKRMRDLLKKSKKKNF
ncbi:hypothetical protein BB559_003600 [Furculomyces boomerangus]|uniref:UBA domain-containing protein n=2 Tax=Harpellales TaxID=61421 RepID=A0A2T9YKC2_9FUNG|nr:hypothetical protein BB559_003600 [Furculomyces boomerangus]PVZ96772.1 hypothetical protein BB558_007306 [Smittium angustum]PWA03034.1 hypothetical protein BB558_000823 [Smittium angustum]